MFYVSSINRGLFGVTDTEDNVEEFYTVRDIMNIVRSYKIYGVSKNGIKVKAECDIARMLISRLQLAHRLPSDIEYRDVDSVLIFSDDGFKIDNLVIPYGVRSVNCSECDCVSVKFPCTLKEIGDYSFKKAHRLKSVNFNGVDINYIGQYAFSEAAIENIKLPDSLEELESSCFSGCTKLVSVKLPSCLKVLKPDCFSYCSSLSDINLSHVIRLGEGSFSKCKSLKSVDLSGLENNLFNNVFHNCTALEQVKLPKEGIDYIGNFCFCNCENLKNFDFSKVRGVISDYAFDHAGVQNLVLNGVSLMQGSFGGSYLKTVTLSGKFNIDEGAFGECGELETVDLSQADINTIPEDCFEECISLERINLPKGLTVIDNRAFVSCSKLKEIDLPYSLEYIGGSAFNSCYKLDSLGALKEIKTIGEYAFGASGLKTIDLIMENNIENNTFWYCNHLKTVSIEFKGGLRSIGSSAFANCMSLQRVSITGAIVHIKEEAFSKCLNLEELNIPKLQHYVASAFLGCPKLKRIVCDSESVIRSLLYDCSSIKEIVFQGEYYGSVDEFLNRGVGFK